ncbi:fimbrial protein [Pseudomonas tolaasii]|uniref:fimbrial protein n=1 Tax=Pseudomonas tolaasii TaxID=29442 RepID=UPI001C5A0C5D|nr:fimbrial protein [Pseudomonas tolaasii]MBW1250804.1 fimbrial protein [Pseudomonas tolaasii]
MKNSLLACCLILLGLTAQCARAACVIQSGWTNRIFNFTFPTNVLYSDNLPVGSVLASRSVSMPADVIYRCGDLDDLTQTRGSYYPRTADASGVMVTNVSGVGVRTTLSSNGSSSVFPASVWSRGGVVVYVQPASVLIEFVKTGPITGGTIDSGYYTGIKGSDGNWFSIYNVSNKINLVRTGCTVNNTAIKVRMGTFSPGSFKGVGPSTTSTSFSIGLDCLAGSKISMTISGTADVSGVQGVLALDPSTSPPAASGLGLQVLFAGTPVTLGTAVPVMNSAPAGAVTIPMTARYYQTAARVTGGPANSTATFTMTYN